MSQPTPKTGEELGRSIKHSANWCFWIAALTAVNVGMAMSGSDQGFVLGTIVAQAVMQWAAMSGSAVGQAVALGFNLVVIGFFIGLGMLAYDLWESDAEEKYRLAGLTFGLIGLAMLARHPVHALRREQLQPFVPAALVQEPRLPI